MAFNIGVNVLEVDGRAAPAIAAAPTSVAGFLVTSERGVPGLPVPLRGPADFRAAFGDYIATSVSAHAVRGFFDNGGAEAYAVRVTNTNPASGSKAASVGLLSRATVPVPTLTVRAGNRGRQDPGTWGNSLAVMVVDHPRGSSRLPAQMTGTAAEPFTLVDGQVLSVNVNGAPTLSVTFRSSDFANIASASAAEVAAAVNRQTTALRAAVTPAQRLMLISANAGQASRLEVLDTPAAVTLGLTAGAGAVLSPATLAAGTTFVGLESSGGFAAGSAVRVETRGHVIGLGAISGTIAAGSGIAVTVDGSATAVQVNFQASDFVTATATAGEVVAAITRQSQGRFTAGLTHDAKLVLLSNTFGGPSAIAVGAPAAGADARTSLNLAGAVAVAATREYGEADLASETHRAIRLAAGTAAGIPMIAARVQTVEFDLVVLRRGAEVERFESLTMQRGLGYYAEAVINDQDRGSQFVTVTDAAPYAVAVNPDAGADAPAEGRDSAGRLIAFALGATALTAGTDVAPVETDFIGDPALRTGLHAFDAVRVQLLACPDSTSVGVALGALAYCEQRGDAMFVGATPFGHDVDGAKSYASALRGRKVFGAVYWPWIEIPNPLDVTGARPRMYVPAVGHVLGTYARIGDARGVWKAPAGDEALLRGATGVERDTTDVEHTDLVKGGGVNAIRAIPGSGIIVDSSRTLSTDTRWLFIGTRRLFNFVKSSLRDGLRWVAQEPHSEELRRAVRFNVITPYLLGLWRQGAFGSSAPEEVFTVVCDASNNPPADVNLGHFKVEVYFYPVKPAETIVIVVGQQESGASAGEA